MTSKTLNVYDQFAERIIDLEPGETTPVPTAMLDDVLSLVPCAGMRYRVSALTDGHTIVTRLYFPLPVRTNKRYWMPPELRGQPWTYQGIDGCWYFRHTKRTPA